VHDLLGAYGHCKSREEDYKVKNPKALKPYGIRLDPAQRAEAARLGIDLGALFRQALKQQIARSQGVCPFCGVKRR